MQLRSEAARHGRHAVLATTVVVMLARDNHYACLWAGDSRAYLLRDRRFSQLTHDHSMVQELFDAGKIAATEILARPDANIITRAVGADELELDKITNRLRPGDRFLLCSDGLFKAVPERDLANLLSEVDEPYAERFLAAALAHHADDNVTAVTVKVIHDNAQVMSECL
jgi:protein phosphatase/serine/threonine-protein phosphatase Stp1